MHSSIEYGKYLTMENIEENDKYPGGDNARFQIEGFLIVYSLHTALSRQVNWRYRPS